MVQHFGLIRLFGCPSLPLTGERDYNGRVPLVRGQEVLYVRPGEERLGYYSLLPKD